MSFRGMRERCEYALALCLRGIVDDEEVTNERLWVVDMDAHALGHSDFAANRHDAPMLFQDIPLLAQAWDEGYEAAAFLFVTAHCPECRDPELPLCPIHG